MAEGAYKRVSVVVEEQSLSFMDMCILLGFHSFYLGDPTNSEQTPLWSDRTTYSQSLEI